jgi:hypothetical protein
MMTDQAAVQSQLRMRAQAAPATESRTWLESRIRTRLQQHSQAGIAAPSTGSEPLQVRERTQAQERAQLQTKAQTQLRQQNNPSGSTNCTEAQTQTSTRARTAAGQARNQP